MNPSLHYATRSYPARIAELGFTASLPADWIDHALPDDDVDFSDPTAFVPLAVLTAPHAAIVMAFGARPAHDDGTLHDWAWYHLQHQQLQPRAVGRQRVAGVGAVGGEATQDSALGEMVVRFAFLEDGDRLLTLTLTAPELFADAVRDAWFELLRTFALASPRGSRFPAEPHADDEPAAPMPEPWLQQQTAVPDPVLEAHTGQTLHAVQRQQLRLDGEAAGDGSRLGELALDDDSIALDDDHPINVDVRRRGGGTVPEIAGLSDRERRATLAAAALGAQIDVPYGWHVADDGRRTLVFAPGGEVQVRLQRVPRWDDGASTTAAAATSLQTFELERLCPDESFVLRASVATTAAQGLHARRLAELVLASAVFDDAADDAGDEESTEAADAADGAGDPGTAGGPPAWWYEALRMEADGRLDAAEQHIRANCPYIGYAASTAEMYRLRMLRLKAAGDAGGALEAFMRSSSHIHHYASMATSGGEGAALSLQRDEFRAALVADYGSDPEARHAGSPAGR